MYSCSSGDSTISISSRSPITKRPTPFLLLEVGCEVFGYEAVKQHTQHVRFEIPPIDAASEVVGYLPDGSVKFVAFLLFGHNIFK